jgi:hypothetical protein
MQDYQEHILFQEDFPDHHYRTEIPNIIFELGLTPYEFLVYCHIKRITGESGKCWQSVREIAKSCGISVTQVAKCIDSLTIPKNGLNLPLIKKTKRKLPNGLNETNLITVVNLWKHNGDHFREKNNLKNKENHQFEEEGGGTPQYGVCTPQYVDKEGIIYNNNISIHKGIANARAYTHACVGAREDNQKQALQEALPFSIEKEASPANEPQKQNKQYQGKSAKRRTERPEWQMVLIAKMNELKLNTDQDTIGWYSHAFHQNIDNAIFRFKKLEKRIKIKICNRGGYFRNLLKGKILKTKRAEENLEMCLRIKEAYKWNTLCLGEDFIYDETYSGYDIMLDQDPKEVIKQMEKLYDTIRRVA